MLRVAAAQFDARSGAVAFNVARHVEAIHEAGARGVDLVLFPELSACGYAADILDATPERLVLEPDGDELRPLRDACREAGVAAVVGSCLAAESGITLSALAIDRSGAVRGRYDKQHLDARERGWFVPGQSGRLLELDGWRLALGICYDSSFPEHARAAALAGADGYLVSGAFPLGASARRRTIYMPARALENSLYVVFANYCGSHAEWTLSGGSAIYGPDGGLLTEAGEADERLVVAELERDHLRQVRASSTMLADRRPEPYSIETIRLR